MDEKSFRTTSAKLGLILAAQIVWRCDYGTLKQKSLILTTSGFTYDMDLKRSTVKLRAQIT